MCVCVGGGGGGDYSQLSKHTYQSCYWLLSFHSFRILFPTVNYSFLKLTVTEYKGETK